MKITIESTNQIVTLVREAKGKDIEIPARVWEGKTESGVHVTCLITRIAAKADQDLTQFERELHETTVPSIEALQAFPLRLIL